MKKIDKDEQAAASAETPESPHDNSVVLTRVKRTEWRLNLPSCLVNWLERWRPKTPKVRENAHGCHVSQE
jgi:hypothetical protein